MAFNPTYAGLGDNKLDVFGATEVGIWTITFSSSDTYVTGGLALTPNTFGLTSPVGLALAGVIVIGQNTTGEGIVWAWNTTTAKLQAFVTGTASGDVLNELASASTAIQSVAITVLAITQR